MPVNEALVAALVEVERHVGRSGWDQPARIFALVPTREFVAAEPSLAPQFAAANPDGFTSIEQDDFHAGDDLGETLARMVWPQSVSGCVLALERAFLPAQAEVDLPDDPSQAARVVAEHPQRLDLRVVVGVTRDGSRHAVARLRTAEQDLLEGAELVPALADALAHTLE
jgi:hypothetical protein